MDRVACPLNLLDPFPHLKSIWKRCRESMVDLPSSGLSSKPSASPASSRACRTRPSSKRSSTPLSSPLVLNQPSLLSRPLLLHLTQLPSRLPLSLSSARHLCPLSLSPPTPTPKKASSMLFATPAKRPVGRMAATPRRGEEVAEDVKENGVGGVDGKEGMMSARAKRRAGEAGKMFAFSRAMKEENKQ